MNAVPVAEVCTNCGAPLDLDETSACRWCHARIRLEQATVPVFPVFRMPDQVSLVPEGVDHCNSSAPFIGLALSALDLLGVQPAVEEYMRREPWLLLQIRALSTAVSAAGVRVRDAGLLKDSFDINLDLYTPEEIWTFGLAFDVIALIGALDGLSGERRALMAENVRQSDWYTHRHTWKKAVKKAGEGPAAFRELRARIPHRG